MDTANNTYTFGMATGEIVSLLLLTFLVGMLLCWLLRQAGLCCKTRKTFTPLPNSKYHTRDFDINTTNAHAKQAVPDVYVPKVKMQPRLVEIPEEITLPAWIAAIDPHKPIIDPPDMTLATDTDLTVDTDFTLDTDLDMPIVQASSWSLPAAPTSIELPEIDPLLAAIDPHKPIIDPPDMEWETPLSLEALTMPIEPPSADLDEPPHDPLLAAIDPHKPIIDPPDMPEATPTTGNLLNSWLHKAKEGVEHLTEKATPATNEWLHKAKEIGNEISAKSSSLTSAETLAKGGSTLAALAASAKELTEKLASNLSTKHDDLQKLVGIGPTFASVLHRAGIHTYEQLSETSPQKLQALLIVEDEQFSKHDTSSWPKQAALAAYGEWAQLKAYQDSLSP
ncbi:MAG: hypothetical protein RL122_1006 [Pseudomonadota bacterium]|jgi:predicted flap endonuclease-1-like 5' DNA nuclease|uniref:DUF4332 domain-containing protein n=1 Tax=Thiothrix fructosivorans TaxID=111770 RepID=A0A8B0SI96_9GAMM|nr:hypothetical protein [Thiothrix fructosivorans]MBO0611592.1 hypothetical protein [Thiothrix fructosivorans]QTX10744.1 hypothetical protein J1836_019635 [Thiothrix fructosivorans]